MSGRLGANPLEEFIDFAVFPVMAKNEAAWSRLATPAVQKNTVVRSAAELRNLAKTWVEPYRVVLQDYIPPEFAEDWYCHAWVGASRESSLLLTGAKLRQYPATGGVTTFSVAVENPELLEINERLLRALGYRGIAALDWRFDRRVGEYKLLDFNPRIGAQFRSLENVAGIDVVRAAHLELTGRQVPKGRQSSGITTTVEHLDHFSRYSRATKSQVPEQTRTLVDGRIRRFAWFALDDPIPFVAMLVWATTQLTYKVGLRRSNSASGQLGTLLPAKPRLLRKRTAR